MKQQRSTKAPKHTRALACGVSAVALAAAISVGTAAPAHALEDCTGSTPHQDLSSGNNYLVSGEPIRSGPHAYCTVRARGPMTVYLDCWAKNTADNIWWFVDGANGSHGWAYEGNLYYSIVRNDGNRCRV